MSKIEIECGRCHGAGKVRSPELEEAFDAIPKAGITALELFKKFPHGNSTAQNARLERLRETGRVTRTREGKSFRYFRAK